MSLVYDLPEAEYHADRETLSSTGAKTLLVSPARFRFEQDNPADSAAYAVGTLTHSLILGTENTFAPVTHARNTKVGKEEEQAILDDGLIPMIARDWELAHGMAASVLRSPLAMEYLSDGKAEVSAYGEDEATGVGMRGRFDWLRNDGVLVDVKTTSKGAGRRDFASSVASLSYQIQAAWYLELAAQNGLGKQRFIHVVVEKAAPFLVGVYELDQDALEDGWVKAEAALAVYQECVMSGRWPDWAAPEALKVQSVSLPRWAFL